MDVQEAIGSLNLAADGRPTIAAGYAGFNITTMIDLGASISVFSLES